MTLFNAGDRVEVISGELIRRQGTIVNIDKGDGYCSVSLDNWTEGHDGGLLSFELIEQGYIPNSVWNLQKNNLFLIMQCEETVKETKKDVERAKKILFK